MFGETLQKQVEDRLKFYESGDLPPKNVDVMQDAVIKAEEAKNKILKREKKKKKKNKKENEGGEENGQKENGICLVFLIYPPPKSDSEFSIKYHKSYLF